MLAEGLRDFRGDYLASSPLRSLHQVRLRRFRQACPAMPGQFGELRLKIGGIVTERRLEESAHSAGALAAFARAVDSSYIPKSDRPQDSWGTTVAAASLGAWVSYFKVPETLAWPVTRRTRLVCHAF